MEWILYLISVIWIASGSSFILYTAEARETVRRLIEKSDSKLLAAIPLVVGVLLIVAGSASSHPWFLRLVGLLALIKGGLIIANPENIWSKLTDWYLNQLSDQAYRLIGIIGIILGTAVFSWVG